MKKGKPDFSNIHTPHFETTEIANQDTALPTKQNKSFATISLETTTFLKRFLLCLMRHKKILIILTAILMLCSSCMFYWEQKKTVTMLLSLNYEESSKGLYPNATRFNMYEIQLDEVLKRALDMAGLEGDLSPEELKKNLTVSPASVKNNLGDTSYYISTNFIITYHLNKEASAIGADDMANLICKAYNDVFHERYIIKQTALKYDLNELKNLEYVEIGNRFDLITAQLDRYLALRIKENASFRASETGESFQTVRKLLQDLQSYGIDNYKSFVLESGLAKNKNQYVKEIAFNNSMLNVMYLKDMANFTVRSDTINMYDEAMIGTVMIPTLSENKEYYMAKANIGMDYLTKDAKEDLLSATDILKSIEDNKNTIQKLSIANSNQGNYDKAEQMIAAINKQLNQITRLTLAVDDEYTKYTTKDYLKFQQSEHSLIQQIGLVDTFGLGICFIILWGIVLYVYDNSNFVRKNLTSKWRRTRDGEEQAEQSF